VIADVFRVPVLVPDQEVTSKASAVGAALQAAAVARGVHVGEVSLSLGQGTGAGTGTGMGDGEDVCHPTLEASVRSVYEAAFKRHVSMSNCIFGDV
jgi:hypothetical protein